MKKRLGVASHPRYRFQQQFMGLLKREIGAEVVDADPGIPKAVFLATVPLTSTTDFDDVCDRQALLAKELGACIKTASARSYSTVTGTLYEVSRLLRSSTWGLVDYATRVLVDLDIRKDVLAREVERNVVETTLELDDEGRQLSTIVTQSIVRLASPSEIASLWYKQGQFSLQVFFLCIKDEDRQSDSVLQRLDTLISWLIQSSIECFDLASELTTVYTNHNFESIPKDFATIMRLKTQIAKARYASAVRLVEQRRQAELKSDGFSQPTNSFPTKTVGARRKGDNAKSTMCQTRAKSKRRPRWR